MNRPYWEVVECLARALNAKGEQEFAGELVDAMRSGSSWSEILGEIGVVLKRYELLPDKLGDSERALWDELTTAVRCASVRFR